MRYITVRNIFIVIWVFAITAVLAVFSIFYGICNGWIGELPTMEELENPQEKYATKIYSADGMEIGTYFRGENREYVSYDSISPNVINALIATEDVRFYNHSGIDARALLRAVSGVITGNSSSGGGSTISQQLAKLMYTEVTENKMDRFTQKPLEWVIAVRLERHYTKEEILTMYLNKYDFGNNAVGIKSAANIYFGKHPLDLNVQEAAMLVGMCKNSSLFNPRRRPEKTKNRRNVVLGQMVKAGYLSQAEVDTLSKTELGLNYHSVSHKTGLAPYFRIYLRDVLTAKKPERKNYASRQNQQFYEDSLDWENNPLYGWCNKNKKSDGTYYNLYSDGLRIYTTIDSRMQKYLEEAVYEHVAMTMQPQFFKEKKKAKNAPFTNKLTNDEVASILNRSKKQTERYRLMKKAGYSDEEIDKAFNTKVEMKIFTYAGEKDTIMTPMDSIRYYKHFLRAGAFSIEPRTGHVKAYVGGLNFEHFEYDMAYIGRRQMGSTIKPFLYSMAMENGFLPCDEVKNEPQYLILDNGKVWSPGNDSRARIGEMVTLKWGLTTSNNWISAYLMDRMDTYAFKKRLHQYGFRNQAIEATKAMCLGTSDASVGEVASAYTAFVNKGMRTEPVFVTRIEDNKGNVLATFTPKRTHVIKEDASYKMIDMLRAVVDEGTGRRLRFRYNITADMGGKTGTTQNNSDAWFVGFTPSLITACWVGGEDRSIHFDNMSQGQGAALALPIWGLYMNKVFGDNTLPYSQSETFNLPEDFDPCGSMETDPGTPVIEEEPDDPFGFDFD